MDQRYKFVRGKPFQGLDDYLKSKSIRAKNKKIFYFIPNSVEGTIFPELISKNPEFGLRSRLGHYYELLSKSIFGGELKKQYDLDENGKVLEVKSEPDLTINNKNKTLSLIEVKSIAPGQALKLLDNQIAKYVSLQTGNYFSKSLEINFNIFRHGISKVQSKYSSRPLDELVYDLAKTTKFLISLPFSVIFEIYKTNDVFIGSRYEGRFYDNLTRFNSSRINDLIANPEQTLEKMKINLENLIIQKSKFPNSVFINNIKIEPFPALVVLDKRSLEEISENMKKDLSENKELSNRFLRINQETEVSPPKDVLFENQTFEAPF